MMATYFHGGSEIQAPDNLQTLYLMNPNYVAAYTSEPHNNQHFLGIPLAAPPPHSDNPASLQGVAVSRVHYNLWGPTPIPDGEPSPMGFRRAQGLSLSLSPHHHQQQHPRQQTNNNSNMSVTVVGGSSSVSNGVMQGSKYLKAAQELLDEVVNVDAKGEIVNNKDKAKAEGSSGGAAVESSKKAAAEQLSTAQRQELQMKKAKLLNMLDEVEQRYKQYNSQMQLVVSSFEQAAGIGSAKSYTSLALQTISRQFRCLKDAIVSQIKATATTLGEEEEPNEGGGGGDGVGSRLRFVDHQLRQQRALQQLGMMQQHNAWRPQRGLPERAVSVLRAWLFEHFLHPYPKDSDKHMLAKQTGLTRSQVSNWFINARVRLWKPMVEEMYVEEMKTKEQNGGNSENATNANTNTNTNTNNSGGDHDQNNNKDQSTSKPTAVLQQQQQQKHNEADGSGLIQAHQQPDNHFHHQLHHQHHQVTNDMISNLSAMTTTSMTSSQGFTLIGSSSDMESLMARSPNKKQRSMQSSPSSILSMDMEMKPPDHHHHHHHQFNPYMVNDMGGRYNPEHYQYHGSSGVSLTLGLPDCDRNRNQRLSQHQSFNIPNPNQLGRRVDIGDEDQSEFCGISMGMGQPNNNGYDAIDIQNRKTFAAHHLLHDFVA